MWVIYVYIEEAGRSEESFPNCLQMLFSDLSAFLSIGLWVSQWIKYVCFEMVVIGFLEEFGDLSVCFDHFTDLVVGLG